MNPQLLPICYLHAGICYPATAGRRATLSSHGDPQLSATGADGIRNAARRASVGVSATIRNPGGQYPQPEQTVFATGYRDPVHGIRRIEVKGRKKGHPIRLTTNEWYKVQQLGDSFWLYVVWSPMEKPDPVPVMIQNPAKLLEHAAKPVVSARFYDIPAKAINEFEEAL